jgi:hypothetical protein
LSPRYGSTTNNRRWVGVEMASSRADNIIDLAAARAVRRARVSEVNPVSIAISMGMISWGLVIIGAYLVWTHHV